MGFYHSNTVKIDLREEILEGLRCPQKVLSSKFFYDEMGSSLFNQICNLEEYYLTRTETKLLQKMSCEIANILAEECHLIEYGCGNSEKIKILLNALRNCKSYTAIDICEEALLELTTDLSLSYPTLSVTAICSDFTSYILKKQDSFSQKKIGFFPGSSIGNFTPQQAIEFLQNAHEAVGEDGGFLIGVDLKKDLNLLHKAYNDSQGVTAAFNKNILKRVNGICGSNFNSDGFEHFAFYNEQEGRIEMHLKSLLDQMVLIGETSISIKKGETIHTENSYKYTPEEFQHLALKAGFNPSRVWLDEDQYFSIHYLQA